MKMPLTDRLDALWKDSNEPPDVFKFFSQVRTTTWQATVSALLLDQQYRWGTDTPIKVEEYLARIARLTANKTDTREIKLQLAVGEFQARQRWNEKPNLEEYASRFDEISDQLSSQLSWVSEEDLTMDQDSAEKSEIDVLSEQFDEALSRGQEPDLDAFLKRGSSGNVDELLASLVRSDLAWRLSKGEKPDLSTYLSRFPEQSDTIRSVFDAVTQEGTILVSGSVNNGGHSDGGESNSGLNNVLETELSGQDLGTEQLGRYRLLRVLGEGAFGLVYLANDEELQRAVAIKVPRKEIFSESRDIDLYLSEARTVASLSHPNIVPVYDAGRTENGSIYVVSKYIRGCTLEERVRESRASIDQVVEWLVPVLDALNHAHHERIIHRDVKPANILLEGSKQIPYLLDFGLAIREEDHRQAGKLAGTPSYMSPEQARGEGHRLDNRSDIFSMGVVLYETLTGQKPFRGRTRRETFNQIVSGEPKPPRAIDDSIPVELERICLKALSKKVSERYSCASELAHELKHWNESPLEDKVQTAIVPKGLRSFDMDDADFFLDLLPGPRNRNGLPESIQFWKTRIEENDSDLTFPVGLVYGPSGCGKSSLVKAGLLPNLSDKVIVVYLEATAGDTEARILHGVQKHLPDLPRGLSLTETFAVLRRCDKEKVLVVIDQFEQLLHSPACAEDSELLNALRQCNGANVQAILMVRDDFAMAAARFMDMLDIPIVQGHNFATVDLFDIQHAEQVLVRFGHAFGRLTHGVESLTNEEEEFVSAVANGLATEGKVVSVHLALFAEMVKGKTWNMKTLSEVGGTAGVGLNFLEETFCSRSANPEHRIHENSARKVLSALLPGLGTDIKGHMKSQDELLEASGYMSRPVQFGHLLRILDGELRLITPTDPDDGDAASSGKSEVTFYQLTHDYLVPSLREWLTRKQQETRRGRANLKLAERSTMWASKQENRYLPNITEWLNIRALSDSKLWTNDQRAMMKTAARLHLTRCSVVLAAAIVFSAGGIATRNYIEQSRRRLSEIKERERRDAEADRIVKSICNANTEQLGAIISTELSEFRPEAEKILQEAYRSSPEVSDTKLNTALAILPQEKGVLPFLGKRLLTVPPRKFKYVRDLINGYENNFLPAFWKVATDESSVNDSNRRFQAACALATYAPQNENWKTPDFSSFLTNHLVGVRPSELVPWIDALRPVKEHLTGNLSRIAKDTLATDQIRVFATEALLEYWKDDPENLFSLLCDATESQFDAIFDQIRVHRERAIVLGTAFVKVPVASYANETWKEQFALRQANAAVMLLRLDAAAQVWPLLKHSPDPRTRSYITHLFSRLGGGPETIMKRYQSEQDASAKRALLLILGEFELNDDQKSDWIETLTTVYRQEADIGLHGVAEYVLRKWGDTKQLVVERDKLQQTEADLVAAGDKAQQWYVNSQGQTYVALDAGEFLMGTPPQASQFIAEVQHRRSINRKFAISTHEVTQRQWRRFAATRVGEVWPADHPNNESLIRAMPSGDCPMIGVNWYEACWYCNWLSEKEGIPKEQWCYETNEEGEYEVGMKAKKDFQNLIGYRLPTEAEWEFACRSGATTELPFGGNVRLLPEYAWFMENSNGGTYPGGSKKPNDFGIFDMFGNCAEWCQTEYHAEYIVGKDGDLIDVSIAVGPLEDIPWPGPVKALVRRVTRGGGYFTPFSDGYFTSARRAMHVPDDRDIRNGFRPARTFHKFP